MMRVPTSHTGLVRSVLVLLVCFPGQARAQEMVELGDRSANCHEDPACFNRLHPAIPMAARAQPGATIVLHSRNASDFDCGGRSSSTGQGFGKRTGAGLVSGSGS